MHNRRESQRFRPGSGFGGITLEDRVVLSQARVNSLIGYEQYLLGRGNKNPWAHFGAPTAAPTTIGVVYKQQVVSAFNNLQGTVGAQATTYLAAVGTANAATARTNFDVASRGALNALTAQLTSQLALLGPSSRGLQNAIQQQILGTGSTSLATAFSLLPTPATGTGNDAAGFQLRISNAIATARQQAEITVGNFIASRGLTQKHLAISGQNPAGHPVSSQYRNVLRGAFAGLANDVANNAGPMLAGTSAEIAANRAEFDSQTEAAVNGLAATLVGAFEVTPGASNALSPAVVQRLLGTGGLLDQIGSLPNPTDTDGTSAEAFGADVGRLVAVASNDVNALYNQFIRGRAISTDIGGINENFGGGFGGFGNSYITASAASPAPNYDPTFLQQFGFSNSLIGQGPDAPQFVYGTTTYGAFNGLSGTSGLNSGLNTALTPATGLNYATTGSLNRTLFGTA